MALDIPFTDLTGPAHCCGPDVCGCTSFETFMERVRLLYPDMGEGVLAHNGIFDGVMKSLLAPLYGQYVSNCGACNLTRELNPCSSCCMLDCWLQEYGLPDDCFEDELFNPCWLTDQERGISLRAQLCARFQIEWNRHLDLAFFERVGDILGIKFTLRAPTAGRDLDRTGLCDLELDWPSGRPDLSGVTSTRVRNPDGSITNCVTRGDGVTQMINVATSRGRECVLPKLTFTITGAPANWYSTVCDPLDAPFCWNPYVDSFKCLVAKYLPCHYEIRFCEDITTRTQIEFDCACPDDCGRYKDCVIGGTGVGGDPYRVDFQKLSEAQVLALVKRLCVKGALNG